jgi:hypothetical protein
MPYLATKSNIKPAQFVIGKEHGNSQRQHIFKHKNVSSCITQNH